MFRKRPPYEQINLILILIVNDNIDFCDNCLSHRSNFFLKFINFFPLKIYNNSAHLYLNVLDRKI